MSKKDNNKIKKVQKSYILSPNLENIKRLKKDEVAARKQLQPELLGHNMIFTEAHAKLLSARLLLLREENRFNIQITDTIFQNAIESYYGKELGDTKNLQGEPKKSCQKQVNDFFSEFRDSENKSKLKEEVVTCSLSTLKNHENCSPKLASKNDKDSADKETIIKQIGYVNSSTSVNDLCFLADFYNVSPSYLLGEIDEKTIENHKINEGLGLSEKSIEFIKSLNSTSKEVLNYLLEQFSKDEMFYYIVNYLNTPMYTNINKFQNISKELDYRVKPADYKDMTNYRDKNLEKRLFVGLYELFKSRKTSEKIEEDYYRKYITRLKRNKERREKYEKSKKI